MHAKHDSEAVHTTKPHHHTVRTQPPPASLGSPRSLRCRQAGMLQWLQRVGQSTETFKAAFVLGDASHTGDYGMYARSFSGANT